MQNIYFEKAKLAADSGFHINKNMKSKIDSVVGKATYAKRNAVAEPPFAHIRNVMGLNHFNLREKRKVNTQWLLFCMVHNLKKVFKYGMEAPVY